MFASKQVVKKGDYYEMQGPQILGVTKIDHKPPVQSNDIVVDLPSFTKARQQYFNDHHNTFTMTSLTQLKMQLQTMLTQDFLKDEDKQEINKLLKQVDMVNQMNQLPLNKLIQKIEDKQMVKQQKIMNKIELVAEISLIEELQLEIKQLQKFNYQPLSRLEHQCEIMLGQKKNPPILSDNSDEKTMKEIESLYTNINSINCVNNLTNLMDKISTNSDKFTQMQSWGREVNSIISNNEDYLAELQADGLILDQLEANFQKNIDKVKIIIDELKFVIKK